MPTLLLKDMCLVKGIQFDSSRHVGTPLQAIRVYEMREVDELVLLDLDATPLKRRPDIELIDELADSCFMPLAVGGGMRSVEDVRAILSAGADKVVINTAAVERPALVSECADQFGTQCVVISIDFRRPHDEHNAQVFTSCGSKPTGRNPVDWATEVEGLGAGEILLTSIDRDGTMDGYDIEMTKQVSRAVSIPVVASGGCGCYADMSAVLMEGGATAVAAASMFHFTEQTPREAKAYLKSQGISVRL